MCETSVLDNKRANLWQLKEGLEVGTADFSQRRYSSSSYNMN